MAHIGPGIGREIFPLQAAADQAADNAVEHGKHRYAQNHPRESKQAAEQQNGEQHPERGQSGGVSQDLGSQNIAVKLLQDEHKDHKVQAFQRIHQQNQERRRDGANEGAKEGNDIGDANDGGDQRRIRELKQIAAHQRDHADDQRVQQLAIDEAAEDPVSIPGLLYDQVPCSGLQHAVNDFLTLRRQQVLSCQQINGHDQGDQQILGQQEYRDDQCRDVGHNAGQIGQDGVLEPPYCGGDRLQIRQNGFLQPVFQRDGSGVVHRHNHGADIRIILQEAHQPHLYGVYIVRNRIDQSHNAQIQLGDHHGQQQINRKHSAQHTQNNGQDVQFLRILKLFQLSLSGHMHEEFADIPMYRQKKKRQDHANGDRPQDPGHLPKESGDHICMVQRKEQQKRSGDHAKGRHANSQVGSILLIFQSITPLG